MNDNILEPNFNGYPPVTDWEKVILVLQQANELLLRGASIKDLSKWIVGDIEIQGSDFYDLPVSTSSTPVALPIPAVANKFGFLANGKFSQPTGGTLEYSATQWGLTLFDGDKWVKKFTLDMPKQSVIDNLNSSSTNESLSAKQGKILNEKIEGGKSITIPGYDQGYLNLTGTISSSSTYRHSKPLPVIEGKTYAALVSGTSSVLVVGAFANENINSFISESPVNKIGSQPGSLPYEVVFTVPTGSAVGFVILSSHTSTPLSDLYLIELDDAGIKNRLLKSETKVTALDKTVYGVEANIPLSWNSGYISLSGVLTTSSSYFNGDFVQVTPGDEYDVLVSGSASTLVISSYSSANQSAFVTGAMSNIPGKGSTAFEVRVKIPQGVYFVKPGRNDNTLKASEAYFRKVDKSSLVSKVDNIDANNVNLVSAPKNYFNFRDKAVFSWIWDDLNPSDEQVYNIFREFNLLPNFALPSRIITTENAKFYKKVYTEGGSILSHDNGSTMGEASLIESRKTIEQLGIKISGYVTPNSVLPIHLLPTAKRVYGYAYTKSGPSKDDYLLSGDEYILSGFDKTVDPGELGRVSVESWNKDDVNQSSLKSFIDYAIINKKKITFYGHKIPSTYMNSDGVTSVFTEIDLRAILTYIRLKVDNGECLFVSSDELMFQTYK